MAYRVVVERLLVTLADAEGSETQQKHSLRRGSPALVSNEDSITWPPWPWPPWDEDGDDDEDDGSGEPINKTIGAHELAKKVVKFERKLAQASLDLCVSKSLISKRLANWLQRYFISRSNRNLQSCSSVQYHGKHSSNPFPHLFFNVHSSHLSAKGDYDVPGLSSIPIQHSQRNFFRSDRGLPCHSCRSSSFPILGHEHRGMAGAAFSPGAFNWRQERGF